MSILEYLIIFVIVYVMIFLFYYFAVIGPQLRAIRNKNKETKKKKKERKYPAELIFLISYYKINVGNIGLIRTLKILNIVNPLILSALIMIVIPLKESWLKILVLTALMIPTIWFTYYFLAKYLKYLERKSE